MSASDHLSPEQQARARLESGDYEGGTIQISPLEGRGMYVRNWRVGESNRGPGAINMGLAVLKDADMTGTPLYLTMGRNRDRLRALYERAGFQETTDLPEMTPDTVHLRREPKSRA